MLIIAYFGGDVKIYMIPIYMIPIVGAIIDRPKSSKARGLRHSGTRLRRDFFAAPLVSELPDGFGSNANLFFARKRAKNKV